MCIVYRYMQSLKHGHVHRHRRFAHRTKLHRWCRCLRYEVNVYKQNREWNAIWPMKWFFFLTVHNIFSLLYLCLNIILSFLYLSLCLVADLFHLSLFLRCYFCFCFCFCGFICCCVLYPCRSKPNLNQLTEWIFQCYAMIHTFICNIELDSSLRSEMNTNGNQSKLANQQPVFGMNPVEMSINKS